MSTLPAPAAEIYGRLFAADPGYGLGDHWRPVWDLLRAAVPPGGQLLDVGCGRGGLLHACSEAGIEAVGVDAAPLDASIIACSLPLLPFFDNEFDVVGCFDVLEHLDEVLIPAAIMELHRVCRRRLIVSIATCSDPRTIPGHGEVELHLTQRPLDWWLEATAATVIPVPGQPEWRHYLDIPIGA